MKISIGDGAGQAQATPCCSTFHILSDGMTNWPAPELAWPAPDQNDKLAQVILVHNR